MAEYASPVISLEGLSSIQIPRSVNAYRHYQIAITGGASGIGLATAEILAARGATLSISDRNQDTLDEAVKAVTKISNGRKHSGTVLDVRDSQAVTGWINKTVSEFGKLDGAANMAGTILEDHTIKEETDEQWKLIMDINASGVFYSLRAELNVMKDGGSIVSLEPFCLLLDS